MEVDLTPATAGRPPVSETELERFYREFFLPLVRRAIRRHHLSNEDARDVVQEAFVIAIAKMGSEGNGHAWLCQVVDFVATNHRRKLLRRAELLARWSGGGRRTIRRVSWDEGI